jgi:hypothetical protein
MSRTLYIIDGHAHIYAAYFAPMRQRLTSPSGEPTRAACIFTSAILGLPVDGPGFSPGENEPDKIITVPQ